jgi:hypothetical protein
MYDSTILDRMFDHLADAVLTPEAAARIVDLRADPTTQAELDELARKCNEGQLTPDEERKYDVYLAAIDFITVLQAKARAVLK